MGETWKKNLNPQAAEGGNAQEHDGMNILALRPSRLLRLKGRIYGFKKFTTKAGGQAKRRTKEGWGQEAHIHSFVYLGAPLWLKFFVSGSFAYPVI
jgi:hypothetical protein